MDDSDVVQQKTEAVKGKIEKLIQNKYFIFIVLILIFAFIVIFLISQKLSRYGGMKQNTCQLQNTLLLACPIKLTPSVRHYSHFWPQFCSK